MKKKVVSISDLDVQPISDEELQAIGAEGGSDDAGSYIECCNGSEYEIIRFC